MASQSDFDLTDVLFNIPALIFVAVCLPLISYLRWAGGQVAARSGLITLPIPLALSIACIGFIGMLTGGSEVTDFARYSIQAFSLSISTLIPASLCMIIGSSLEPKTSVRVTRKLPPQEVFRNLILSSLFLLPSWFLVEYFVGVRTGATADVFSISLYTFTFLSIVFLGLGSNLSYGFLADCVLKTVFYLSIISLVAFIYSLSTLGDLGQFGSNLAVGWLCLFYGSLSLVILQIYKIVYEEGSEEDDIFRNWHLLELFCFYIFLSMAPPTIFDILGFSVGA